MTIKNNATVVSTSTQRINALKKYVPAKGEITINGEKYKLAALIAAFQDGLEARAEAHSKQTEYQMALANREAREAASLAIDKGIRAWVTYQFGADSQAARDFGYPPPKIAIKTVETKMLAIGKAKATRIARHTMGKKEKLKIKGTTVAPAASAEPVSLSNGANGVVATSLTLNGVAH